MDHVRNFAAVYAMKYIGTDSPEAPEPKPENHKLLNPKALSRKTLKP